jgi:hypothetical protein
LLRSAPTAIWLAMLQTEVTTELTPKRRKERRGQLFKRVREVVPTTLRRPVTTFDLLAQAGLVGPDFLYRLSGLFDRKVGFETLRSWRRGFRKAPDWAIEIVEAECRRVRDACQRALDALERERALRLERERDGKL